MIVNLDISVSCLGPAGGPRMGPMGITDVSLCDTRIFNFDVLLGKLRLSISV